MYVCVWINKGSQFDVAGLMHALCSKSMFLVDQEDFPKERREYSEGTCTNSGGTGIGWLRFPRLSSSIRAM